ncbi:MAG: suppressor of fused domain protein [Oscillospiraceae bacterium]
METVHGKVAFLQLVGLTQPELDALARDPDALDGILERMRADDPELVLDMRRTKSYV